MEELCSPIAAPGEYAETPRSADDVVAAAQAALQDVRERQAAADYDRIMEVRKHLIKTGQLVLDSSDVYYPAQ